MRITVPLAIALASIFSSGCTLCSPGYLNDYAGVGGKWQRTDPENGRVGSVFSDPGSVIVSGEPAPVVTSEGYYSTDPIYEEPSEYGDSVLEHSSSDDGVIILGDDWGS
jgi:hypothetical protein